MTQPALTSASGEAWNPREAEFQQPPDLQQLSLREAFWIVKRHRLLIGGIVAAATLLVGITQFLSPSVYQSTATLQVELIDKVGNNEAEAGSANVQRVQNEVKLHRARAAAEQVVRDLNLTRDPQFWAETTPPGRAPTAREIQRAGDRLLGMVDINAASTSDLIDIAVFSGSPQLSARIANQYPDSVRKLRFAKLEARRHQMLDALGADLEKQTLAATAAARELAQFRKDHGMLVGAGGAEDLSQINRIAAEAASATGMRAGSSARAAGVARAAAMRSSAGATSAVLQQLQRQNAELTAERARMSAIYGAGHPDIISLDSQLAEVRESLAREERNAQAAAEAQVAAEAAREAQLARSEAAHDAARAGQLQGLLGRITAKAYDNTSNSVELARLEREAELAAKTYLDIAGRAEQVRSQLGSLAVLSTIVSPAVANAQAISPNPRRAVGIAFVGSLLFALLVALIAELVDVRLRTGDQIRRHFQLPTFGMFPILRGLRNESLQDSPVLRDPESLFAEVARSVEHEVRALAEPGKPQSVLITSPLPGDGKSTVALSLCAAAVSSGLRAIVVDFDLRNPLIPKLAGEVERPDLLDYLDGRGDLRKLLPPALDRGGDKVEEAPRLVLLATGTAIRNPGALITRRRLTPLFDRLRREFDLIVINAPPVLAVRDPRALAEVADTTLIVARWGHTTIDQMRSSLDLLNHRVAGAVFDQVDYVEHARRGYGGSVQFYMDSIKYYSGPAPHHRSFEEKTRDALAGFAAGVRGAFSPRRWR